MPVKGDRTWTDDDLRAAVEASKTYAEVMQRLALSPRGRNHRNIQAAILRLGLDTSHFVTRVRRFADEQLRAIVPECTSYNMVLQRLGLDLGESELAWLKRRIGLLGVATQHFVRTAAPRTRRKPRWTDDDLRRAIGGSRSVAGVLRALGLVPA
ncbi:MAG TPA: hypothetical protein VK427_02235, partial [Kofleriaceae bacterium]|nr:hypothetical protein [Kofleriaceae bacterium]